MKKVNSMLLGGLALVCSIAEAGTKIQNDNKVLRKIEINRPWGNLNYTTFSHFDIVFDQFDLKRAKACSIEGGLRIPIGVTHVLLDLSGTYEFVEFPETVKFIKKDIFKKCKVKTILLNNKTIENLLKKNYGENSEENLRKYFSLNDNTEIIIGGIIDPSNKIEYSTPTPPLSIKDREPKNSFLDEIHTFNKDNLKHIEDEKTKKDSNENKFTNEIQNFDKNKLKHVENDKKVNQAPKDLKTSDPMVDSFLEVMKKRRAHIAPDSDEEEESDWED